MPAVEESEAALQTWHRARSADGREPEDARVERVRAKLSDLSAITALVGRRAQVVGMGVAEPFREHAGLGEPRPGWGHITMVFVDPNHQGVGVGSEALELLITLVPWPSLSLWTRESNLRAQRLCQRCRFRATGDLAQLVGGEPIRRWEFPA